MEKNIADVSIIVANYNNGKYLSKLISSINDSTFLPRELVIVDDGSSDDSVTQLESYSLRYSFIKLIKFASNKGFANALNEGVHSSTGKYILRVDADDFVSTIRIEEQFNFMESNPHIDVLGSNITYFDSDSGEEIFNSNVPLLHNGIIKAFKNGNCGIIHGSMICKRSIIERYLYNQHSVPAEDYELFSLILKDGHSAFNLSKPLTFVRIHINSVSNNLPFNTIQKTFQLNKKIWGIKNSHFKIRRIHLHLKYYRKFLFCKGSIKYIYLLFSVFFNPIKLLSRLTKKRLTLLF